MRKIFLDCGANNGCSVEKFRNLYGEGYEIYSFEPNRAYKNALSKLDINYYQVSVWDRNEKIRFYNDWSNITKSNSYYEVEAIDFNQFILDNFQPNDEIILKMDIEGAEYRVIKRMMLGGSLAYINKFYGELHSYKDGFNYKDDFQLIDTINAHGLSVNAWDAQAEKNRNKEQVVIDKKQMFRQYKTWKKQNKHGSDKINLDEIKLHL